MPKRLLLLASILLLIPLLGCPPAEPPAPAAPAATPAPAAPSISPWFTNHAWVQTGSPDLPGVMRIFLADGTLVMDSCWETYRLAQWRLVSAASLVIVEDGQEIPAEITANSDGGLSLRLTLVGGETKDEVYQMATVPYICPDMPR